MTTCVENPIRKIYVQSNKINAGRLETTQLPPWLTRRKIFSVVMNKLP